MKATDEIDKRRMPENSTSFAESNLQAKKILFLKDYQHFYRLVMSKKHPSKYIPVVLESDFVYQNKVL